MTNESIRNLRKARDLCQTCEVRADCLEDGLGEEYGMWGGVSPKQRYRIRKAKPS